MFVEKTDLRTARWKQADPQTLEIEDEQDVKKYLQPSDHVQSLVLSNVSTDNVKEVANVFHNLEFLRFS